MKANYNCVNFNCGYSTNREDNLKVRNLNEVVKAEGGEISSHSATCPKCKGNTLVFFLE